MGRTEPDSHAAKSVRIRLHSEQCQVWKNASIYGSHLASQQNSAKRTRKSREIMLEHDREWKNTVEQYGIYWNELRKARERLEKEEGLGRKW